MVADRQVLPVGRERLGVGAEDAPDVGRVVLARVEVDVVRDLDGQVHRHLGRAGRGGLHGVAVRLVGQLLGEPLAGGGPRLAALLEEGLSEAPRHTTAGLHAGLLRAGRGVEHVVAHPHPDARRAPPVEKTP